MGLCNLEVKLSVIPQSLKRQMFIQIQLVYLQTCVFYTTLLSTGAFYTWYTGLFVYGKLYSVPLFILNMFRRFTSIN